MDIKFLFAPVSVDSADTAINHLQRSGIWVPFDDRAVSFVNQFSLRLLKTPGIHQHPDLVALAYWFRRASIKKLREIYTDGDEFIRVGRGLSLHIAPGNVDTIFVYSFFLSLLSGNSSFIRVSQSESLQLNILIKVFNEIYEFSDSEAAARFVICTYPHDSHVTSLVSRHCDIRLIWGGDDTVSAIGALPLKSTATELKFPNRTSFSAVKLDSLKTLGHDDLQKLTSLFYNDIKLFGQQACSSPIAIFFIGLPSEKDQIDRFWDCFRLVARQHSIEPSAVMNRFVAACSMVVSGVADRNLTSFDSNNVIVLDGILASDKTFRVDHSGEGLLIQYILASLTDLASHIDAQDQTLSTFGFTKDEIEAFAKKLTNRGIDRIVPIGEALSFSHIWDGSDLIDSMSRMIDISKFR